MGSLFDPDTDRTRAAHALIFTACLSRHSFVWVSFTQTTQAVIEGCEAAWAFFGGVFRTVIPDNMSAIVDKANRLEPRLNVAFVEYAQARGFAVDPARVRRPQDKARAERTVPYVRASQFAGEHFVDRDDAQRAAEAWCRDKAGMRIHGTTQCRPAELFATEERPQLLPAPTMPYDLPTYPRPKVHPDHHIEVDKALYSVPGNLIGHNVEVRADRALVKIFFRGQLIKVHARTTVGGRRTDDGDLPSERTAYALRDIEHLKRLAAGHGPAVGAYAAALLDIPLPWTRMRQVYALLGLVKRWGADRVDAACAKALEAEAVSVPLIGRMLERATENDAGAEPSPGAAPPGRFARTPSTSRSASSRPSMPLVVTGERAGAHHLGRAQGPAATGQARALPRHPARAPPSPRPSPWPSP